MVVPTGIVQNLPQCRTDLYAQVLTQASFEGLASDLAAVELLVQRLEGLRGLAGVDLGGRYGTARGRSGLGLEAAQDSAEGGSRLGNTAYSLVLDLDRVSLGFHYKQVHPPFPNPPVFLAMSQGLGSILSPKGKLVQPRLRVKYARPRLTAFEEKKRHQPRPSLPDMGKTEVPLLTSASRRALSKPSQVPTPVPVSTLAAEESVLKQEIAELQQILLGGKRAERRQEEREALGRELKEERGAAKDVRKEVEMYATLFQSVYRSVLYQDQFEADVKALKLMLENSASRRVQRPHTSQLATSLKGLFKRSCRTLSGWKQALA